MASTPAAEPLADARAPCTPDPAQLWLPDVRWPWGCAVRSVTQLGEASAHLEGDRHLKTENPAMGPRRCSGWQVPLPAHVFLGT